MIRTTRSILRGKNVVVVGMGNSAMDVASELSQRHLAKKLWVAARRGGGSCPRWRRQADGQIGDAASWMPRKLGKAIARRMIKKMVGRMEDYGLPTPDHEHVRRASLGVRRVPDQGRAAATSLSSPTSRRWKGSASGSRTTASRMSTPSSTPPATGSVSRSSTIRRCCPMPKPFPLFKRMMIPGVGDLFFMAGPAAADAGELRRTAVEAGGRLSCRPLRFAAGRRDGGGLRPATKQWSSVTTTSPRGTPSRSILPATSPISTRRLPAANGAARPVRARPPPDSRSLARRALADVKADPGDVHRYVAQFRVTAQNGQRKLRCRNQGALDRVSAIIVGGDDHRSAQ